MNAFEAVTSSHWLILPPFLQAIAEISAREVVTPEIVAARIGKPLEESRKATKRGCVAIIPVTGPIFRRANMFAEVSGATSINTLSLDLRVALDDPQVSSIVLEIDSPGGEANGTHEFASMVRDASKPVHAYIDGSGASGAYWIASAAKTMTLSPTALVGSIGAVTTIRKDDKQSAQSLEFVSSRSPNKRANIETEKGRAQVQKLIDSIGDMFISEVSKNRDVSEDTVVNDFGGGGLLMGQSAVDVGMADHVGTFESLISQLNAGCPPKRMPAPKKKGKPMTRDEMEAVTATLIPTVSVEDFEKVKAQLAEQTRINAEARLRDEERTRSALLGGVVETIDRHVKAERLRVASRLPATLVAVQAALDDAGITTHVAGLNDKKEVVLADATSAKPSRSAILAQLLDSLPSSGFTVEHMADRVQILSNDSTKVQDLGYLDSFIEQRNGAGRSKSASR